MTSKQSGTPVPSVFNFNSIQVRAFADANGEPWFLANDVCEVLGYANPRDAIAKHCREAGVLKQDTPLECDVAKRDTTSKARLSQEMTYINEGNLYRLIVKSRKPEAQAFEQKLMEEILPTIRKTGGYGQAQPAAELPALPNHQHITPLQAEEISTLICALFPGHLERHNAWRRFKGNFKIHSYRRLPASKFDEAITFIESTDARRRNEFGREAQMGSSLALRNVAPQIDLDALSRQVAEYLQAGQQGEAGNVDQEAMAEIEALLSKTMEEFNSLPNNLIFQNLHAVMNLIKKGKSKGNGRAEVYYLPAPQQKSARQRELVKLMRELDMVCIEIGLSEIEAAAGCDAEHICTGDISGITAKALKKRPEHLADIHLISGWLFAEATCTEAQRDVVRGHWLDVAQSIEDDARS
jgi:prophage antirepressor-like protein